MVEDRRANSTELYDIATRSQTDLRWLVFLQPLQPRYPTESFVRQCRLETAKSFAEPCFMFIDLVSVICTECHGSVVESSRELDAGH